MTPVGPPGQHALDPAAARACRRPCISESTTARSCSPGDPLDAHDDLEGPLALELVEDQLQQLRRSGDAGRSRW